MKETIKHKDAFEFFLSLGDKRSQKAVANKLKVSVQTINKWSKKFGWPLRVSQREIDIVKIVEKKCNKSIADAKADYRTEIEASLLLLKTILKVNKKKWGKNLEDSPDIKTINDLSKLFTEMERMMKLSMVLVGENISENDITINVSIVD